MLNLLEILVLIYKKMDSEVKPRHPRSKKKIALIVMASLVVALIILAFVFWLVFWRSSNPNPFSRQIVNSVNFPLYYPAKLPPGFHIDDKSVTTPQTGVVVYDIVGPDNQKIYVSEEARLSTYNFGPFLASINNPQVKVTNLGTLEVGFLGDTSTTIATLITSKTWLIAKTTSSLTLDQLKAMLISPHTAS